MTKKPRRRRRGKAGMAPASPVLRPGPPSARIPLPAKTQKRHGDGTKYDRARQKKAMRQELDAAPAREGS